MKVHGVDVFDPKTGEVRSDGAEGIACWFIDTDYNEESFFVRHAYFLGANDPYKSLKTTLKAEINEEAWETLNSDTSRPFEKPAIRPHRSKSNQPPRRRSHEGLPGELMAWQPRTVLRFIKAYPTSTRVVRVDTDAGEGFLKAMGNPEGLHTLACELVGTLLAGWLGLRTLEHAIVRLTPEDEIPFANGGWAQPGPAFVTKAEVGFSWGGDSNTLFRTLNQVDISKMVVLDTWIRNCDRYRPEPNFRMNRDNVFLAWSIEPERGLVLKAIDHTHAFTCGGELTPRIAHLDNIRDTTVYGRFPEFTPFLHRNDVRSVAKRLSEMDRTQADVFVARVPKAWQVEAPVREAWSAYIVQRAAFVAANMEAWLFEGQPGGIEP